MGRPIRHADTAPAVADGTNLPFKRWDTVYLNASCAVALIDRLTRHAEILVIEGRSLPPARGRTRTAAAQTPPTA